MSVKFVFFLISISLIFCQTHANSVTKPKNELQKDQQIKQLQKQNEKMKDYVSDLRKTTAGAPVVVFKDTVFLIYSKLGPFNPAERAKSISEKIELLVTNNLYSSTKLKIFESAESVDLLHEDLILLSITEQDAFWLNKSRKQIAEEYSLALQNSIKTYIEHTSFVSTLIRIGLLFLVLAIFWIGIRLMNKIFTWMNLWIIKKGTRFITGVKFRNYEFLSAEQEKTIIHLILKMLKWTSIAFIVYLTLPIMFSIFPATKGIAATLFGYIVNPIKGFLSALIQYIPELFTIFVIAAIAKYVVRFLKFISLEIENEKLQLPGFYADWAAPTYNISKLIIYAFSFIIIFPYLPGSDSPAFQGVSVFLGLLISLGSSSAIGNIIAGLVIIYMRAFKIGDRVKIGDVVGDVIEKTMLVTRIKTTKNEEVTIPNSSILNGSTINYSSSNLGLILNTTITIGYDVPWRKVHELLITAALKTNFIKDDPKPFVLQTSLDDFYVSYQINAYTESPNRSAGIYSDLHSNIQDVFNENGVEILSPHYRAARDGNMVTIPAEYLPEDYKIPSFQVEVTKHPSKT